jgi:hypothetical protein
MLRKLMMIALLAICIVPVQLLASSHREAPLISNDPLADNTDLYAFRSPDGSNTITIIANYIPFELPEGGPNYSSFGENIRYEIHIKNSASTVGDDITYRFTFTKVNEDPTTFFNIRLGKQNLKTTYTLQKSVHGGAFVTIITNGVVPPANIGPRSIESGYGLQPAPAKYGDLMTSAIKPATGTGGETVFAGPIDDPFFVDLAGIFDLGGFDSVARDGLAGFNCHTIAMKIPISTLQKDGKDVSMAANILDGNFVIGVWASASRPEITTLYSNGNAPTFNDTWIQVSRLGMPLTNEAIIPIGMKDRWNATSPYNAAVEVNAFQGYFGNPELELYTGGKNYSPYGFAIPGLAKLKTDSASLKYLFPSLGGFDFRYGKDGLAGLLGNPLTAGTALDTAGGFAAGHFGSVLLQTKHPRSVDLLPIFYTGVPNAVPYQLATGKDPMNPLTPGKPFINNFLPTLGDMLRLNMAVPATLRNSPDFSSEGLIKAAVLGLLDSRFNKNTNIENIPNMDGFPNGRRLEDDVTTIEMQAVGGLVLNAIGLWTDDYSGQASGVVTKQLLDKVTWNAGITHNDVKFQTSFPFVAEPHRGSIGLQTDPTVAVPFATNTASVGGHQPTSIGVGAPAGFFIGQSYPNPTNQVTTMSFHSAVSGNATVKIYDVNGREVSTLMNARQEPGNYSVQWAPSTATANGTYFAVLYLNGSRVQTQKITVSK